MTGILGWLLAWFFIKGIFMPLTGGLKKMLQNINLNEFISPQTSAKQFEQLMPYIDHHLDDFFKNKLSQKMPIISMFVGDKTVTELKGVFMDELQLIFPELLNKFIENSKNEFLVDFEKKWSKKLEPILLKATTKLRFFCFTIGILWGILILVLTQIV
jgi:hypothetical protein